MTAETDFPELQKGQLKVASSFCLAAFGGGLLDFRFPIFVVFYAVQALLERVC